MAGTMSRLLRAPMFWILLLAAGLRLAGLAWGLPAADGWDDDGFAPRNFLTALALTWKPGAYFTYPPLHAILLAVPALPVAAWALAHAPSLSQHDVIATITQPSYMTYFAVLGRLVSLLMSLGIIWTIGEMARVVAGRRAGLFAAGACALNFALTYYGQVSNLDVPYLFWALLSLLWCMRSVMEQAPRRVWLAGLFAAAAVATKDQAYALFLLSLPLFLLLWFISDRWPRAHAARVVKALLPAAIVALLLLLLVDGTITNPSGFVRRIAFLAGPASRDYAEYWRGPAGWLALLEDMLHYFAGGYGLLPMVLAAAGVGLHFLRAEGRARLAGALPLLAAISFTLCFNFAALRSDDRFLLPQGVLATFYIGIAAEALAFATQDRLRLAGRALLVVTALLALHWCIAINAALLRDPRYDAEGWLQVHVKPGDVIETYGQNCFLPRFPRDAMVTRIGQGDPRLRNPLPGVTERQQPFIAPRQSRFIVVSLAWARRYLRAAVPLGAGRVYSPLQQADFANGDAHMYFTALAAGKLNYRLAYAASYHGIWPVVHIHDSLDEAIWIFERDR
jgi:4-amino-4-deoxy-L-arabinose transferase-like glycosyltransferase